MPDRKRTFDEPGEHRPHALSPVDHAHRSSTIAVSVVPPVARRSAAKRPASADPTIAAPVLPRLPSSQATLCVPTLEDDAPTPRHTVVVSAKPNFRQRPTVFDDGGDLAIDIDLDAEATDDGPDLHDGEFEIPLDDEPTLRVSKRADPTTARQRATGPRTAGRRGPTFEHVGVQDRGASVWLFVAGVAAICGTVAFVLA